MRFVDIVLGCAILGLAVGYLQLAQPSVANAGTASETRNVVSERMTWLRMPVMMRRTGAVQ
jgi:hypothetical protein